MADREKGEEKREQEKMRSFEILLESVASCCWLFASTETTSRLCNYG
jgi:hypothetical protein